jgi:hypothetical protein
MDAQSTALPDMSGDDFYINLHPEFIERLGYMAGVNGGLYNPPFPCRTLPITMASMASWVR